MKPIVERTKPRKDGNFLPPPKRAEFPIVDCNYQAFSLDRYYGGSTGSSPASSFLNISRDYFQQEARRNFLAEIGFFLVLAAILTATFIEGARAIIHFLHLPPA
jgi:hypothetical protein